MRAERVAGERWEYQWCVFDHHVDTRRLGSVFNREMAAKQSEALSASGAEGWEAMSVIQEKAPGDYGYAVLFKRRVES